MAYTTVNVLVKHKAWFVAAHSYYLGFAFLLITCSPLKKKAHCGNIPAVYHFVNAYS